MVVRFLLSLVFDTCEEEGDAEGLRALRRVMVCYFLAHKPERLDSKYASFTLIDIVVDPEREWIFMSPSTHLGHLEVASSRINIKYIVLGKLSK